MKYIKLWSFLLLLNLLLSFHGRAQEQADLYVVHFETGPAWQEGVAPAKQTGFGEHASNLQQLRKAGVIKFGARYERYGMIFLASDSLESAQALLDADPGVKTGLFVYKIAKLNVFYPWLDSIEIEG